MKWKKDLEALVSETMSFVKGVRPDTATPPSVPDPQVEPPFRSAPEASSVEQPTTPLLPAELPPREALRFAPPAAAGSERAEIAKRTEAYRALQRQRIEALDEFYQRQMARIRSELKPRSSD